MLNTNLQCMFEIKCRKGLITCIYLPFQKKNQNWAEIVLMLQEEIGRFVCRFLKD